MNTTELFNNLKRFNSTLSDEGIHALIQVGRFIEVKAGTTVISQGDRSREVYFLLHGRLTVEVENQYGEISKINEIAQGEFFGEMAMLTEASRATTLIAIKDSSLLRIESDDFERLLETHSSILKYMGTTIIGRLRKANLAKAEVSFKNVCFVKLSGHSCLDKALRLSAASLRKGKPSITVTREMAKEAGILHSDLSAEEEQQRFRNWVHDLEWQYDYVLYVCSGDDLQWAEWCLKQADRIMFACTAETGGAFTELEDSLLHRRGIAGRIERDLIVVRENDSKAANTGELLRFRKVTNIFHVVGTQGVGRIVRYIKGESVKLVLGGGGAKGFAHLGVLKAMVELEIPVDFVGGTSVGSIMASAIAMGWPYDKIVETMRHALVANNPMNDYRLPLISMLRGRKLDRMLNEFFGETLIEDLPVPYFAVASNFSKSRMEVLERGPVRHAIRASISLPAILPPVVHGNDLLLDGGIVDNLPIEHMDTRAQGPVIGVDLSAAKERKLGYDKLPGNGKMLAQKFKRGKRLSIPNMFQIIMGTMTLASGEKRTRNENKFDVCILPDVSRYGFLKWDSFDQVLEEGYKAGLPLLQQWKAAQQADFSPAD